MVLTMKDARDVTLWESAIGLLVAMALLVLTGCNPVPDQPPPGATTCADVCHHGAELDCAWARPTPEGTTCTEVCEHAKGGIPWRLDCVVLAGSCEDANVCSRR